MPAPVSKGAIALAALTVILTIAGCASTGSVAPQDSLKDASTLDAGAAIRAADAQAGWPSAHWWRAYGDPQLNDWVERANAGSPTLAIAAARVREAQSLVGVARSALAPHVDGSLDVTRQSWPDNGYYGPGPFNNTTTWNNTAALSLSYNLDLWGRDENAAERAVDAAHVRAADARAAQLELETNVVRTYIGLSQDFALLDIARDTLAQQQKIADLARRRLAGRPRHATRTEPGRNAAAGIRAPGRCLQRGDRTRAQSARRARGSGSGRGCVARASGAFAGPAARTAVRAAR